MLEEPDLPTHKIAALIRQAYGLVVDRIKFLPLGYDSYAAVYRLCTADNTVYLLKLRQDETRASALLVPHYLRQSGLRQVIAPLPTKTNALWTRAGDFTLILYPFIEGRIGMEIGLSPRQWTELGTVLRAVHAAALPFDLAVHAPCETFVPKWARVVRQLQARISTGDDFVDPLSQKLAAFWRSRWDEIDEIVAHGDELGHRLQTQSPDFVLCHADIHTANVLIDDAGDLHVIDWDETLLAPKERDLMFVVDAAIGGAAVSQPETDAFFKGYGRVEVDWLALAYYRYEWVVQEIGEFGELVFLRDDIGIETRQTAVYDFIALFQPGDVVDAAYRSAQHLRKCES